MHLLDLCYLFCLCQKLKKGGFLFRRKKPNYYTQNKCSLTFHLRHTHIYWSILLRQIEFSRTGNVMHLCIYLSKVCLLLLCNKQHGVKNDCSFNTLCMADLNIISQWLTLFRHLGSMRLMSSYGISIVTYLRNICNMHVWNVSYIKTCSSFLFLPFILVLFIVSWPQFLLLSLTPVSPCTSPLLSKYQHQTWLNKTH